MTLPAVPTRHQTPLRSRSSGWRARLGRLAALVRTLGDGADGRRSPPHE